MASTTLGLKVEKETRDRLKRLAEARDRSAHWLLKEALTRYLDEEERYEREKAEDLARWERYAETGSAVSHEEVAGRVAALRERALARAEGE